MCAQAAKTPEHQEPFDYDAFIPYAQDDRHIAAGISKGTAASAQLDSTPSTQEYEMSNKQQQRDFKVAPFAGRPIRAQEEKSAVGDAHGQCLHRGHDETNGVSVSHG